MGSRRDRLGGIDFCQGLVVNFTLVIALGSPLDKTREWLSLPDHYLPAIVSAMAVVGLSLVSLARQHMALRAESEEGVLSLALPICLRQGLKRARLAVGG